MMMRTNRLLKLFSVMMVFVSVLIAGLPTSGYGQVPEIESKADQLLKKMSDYLDGLKQFSVQTENTLEVVLKSGQKIQYDNPAELSLQRPNKLHAKRAGDIVDQELYYDGKTLPLFRKTKTTLPRLRYPQPLMKRSILPGTIWISFVPVVISSTAAHTVFSPKMSYQGFTSV
jgi:hypothetical protein